MEKGILYAMTTAIPGLIKIGKTGSTNYEQRMYNLEHNGYRNATSLKRAFAIEVDNYEDKEILLQNIFEKSRVADTELFALDINIVKQLLASFDGEVIFPKTETKEEVFTTATNKQIPDGEYYLERKVKKWDNRTVKATLRVKEGKLYVCKGSMVCPHKGIGFSLANIEKMREKAKIENDLLMEDLEATSPSAAAGFVIYSNANGWSDWKLSDRKTSLNEFRNK